GADQLFAYSIASTGALSALTPATLVTGANPVAVAASPVARLVYVANGNSTLAVFSYSSAGALSQVGTPVTLAAVPRAIAIDPTGSFLYVAASTNILEFDIGATGALTANPTSSPAAGSAPDALAFDPSGNHLLATNYAASTLTLFSVDGTNHGALTTTGSSKSVGSTPTGIAVDAAGTHVYVSNGGGAGASQVYAFTLTGNVLGDVSGSPFSVAPGVGPQTVALDGGFAYTPNLSSDDVSRMTVNGSTGVLGTASTTPAGDGPADMVFANP
ncbi:MAG TPA: beta-propeller fold lactonase family protein, partial [Candidatus Binatia bacterium]|nr:beta-propeller fold lactonase family protein [Candidatus Binatia bacterium]